MLDCMKIFSSVYSLINFFERDSLIFRVTFSMKFRYTIICFSLLLVSCALFIPGYSDYSSAKKSLKNNDYDSAVYYVARSLNAKPNNKKAIRLLEIAYSQAVTLHKQTIKKLSAQTRSKSNEDKAKWPQLVHEYEALIKLGSTIDGLRPVLMSAVNYNLVLTADDYSVELADAKPKAADYHYTKGMDHREDITKQSQKQAAINFKLALKYVPGYMNAQELYEETKAAATFTLLIMPFDGPDNITGFIRDQMMMNQSNASKEFLKIVNRDQLETILNEFALVQSGITENNYMEVGELSGADHILSATIVTTHSPVQKITDSNIKQQREVVISTEEVVDSAGVTQTIKIKGTVKATVQHFKKRAGASLTLSYKITDLNDNQIIYRGTVNGKENFFNEWATYKGDERALSSNYKRLVKNKERFAPDAETLILKIAKSTSIKFQRKVANHYSN